MTTVSILGAGSWGTAFAQVVADSGHQVLLWGRDQAVVAEINARHTNSKFHPGIELLASIRATSDAPEALDADVVVLAVPTQVLRSNLRLWTPYISDDSLVVSLLKGLEMSSSLRVSEIVAQEWGHEADKFALVTGPNLAGEIIARQPAAGVVASTSEESALLLQSLSSAPYFRPYTSTDVVGCEIAGVGKNVIAFTVGMAVGLGMGDNTQATVITRGLAEITRLGVAMGADEATFSGLAGLGDLVATCSSPLSRNRTFGERMGKGLTLSEATEAASTTAEAIKSARPLLELAVHHGESMPITEAVVAVIEGALTPTDAVRKLMSREKRAE